MENIIQNIFFREIGMVLHKFLFFGVWSYTHRDYDKLDQTNHRVSKADLDLTQIG